MTFVKNSKRRFRWSSIIIVFLAMCFCGGCSGNKLITRAYPLGRYPKTTEKIVDEIVCEEITKNIDAEQQRSSRTIYTLVPEEKCIVVKTTSEGHRQIEASLKHLEEQSIVPIED